MQVALKVFEFAEIETLLTLCLNFSKCEDSRQQFAISAHSGAALSGLGVLRFWRDCGKQRILNRRGRGEDPQSARRNSAESKLRHYHYSARIAHAPSGAVSFLVHL